MTGLKFVANCLIAFGALAIGGITLLAGDKVFAAPGPCQRCLNACLTVKPWTKACVCACSVANGGTCPPGSIGLPCASANGNPSCDNGCASTLAPCVAGTGCNGQGTCPAAECPCNCNSTGGTGCGCS